MAMSALAALFLGSAVALADTQASALGQVQQTPTPPPAPNITAIWPKYVSPSENNTYRFRILGQHLTVPQLTGPDGTRKAQVWFDTYPFRMDEIQWVQKRPDETEMSKAGQPYGFASENGQEIDLWGIPRGWHGVRSVQIGTVENKSDPMNVTLSYLSGTWPKWVAFGFVAILIGILWVISRALSPHLVADKKCTLLSEWFLDPDTDTYSLSKFQFYVWTAAAVFGYIFLTASKSLIQGKFEFADIPGNLPGILFVSAATTVAAVGVTAVKGPKGAGDVYPCLADFITASGIVVAERVQFFVWTVVGVVGFLYIIWFSDPSTVEGLPKIPVGFLQLMGISAAGYLGGKLARNRGPVIDSIVIVEEAPDGSKLVLKIIGTGLSQDASFKIEDKEAKPDPTPGKDPRPTVVVGEDDFTSSGMAKVLQLSIYNPPNTWLPEVLKLPKMKLTIINPDGKMAVWPFETAKTTQS